MRTRAGLEGYGDLAPTGIWSPDRPARSESLYQLRYPGPPVSMPSVIFMRMWVLLSRGINFICAHLLQVGIAAASR